MKLTLDPNEAEAIRTLIAAELDHKRVEIRRARNFEYKAELVAHERLLRRLDGRLQEEPEADEVEDAGMFAGDESDQRTWAGLESPSDSLS